MNREPAVIVMVKAPRAGEVKTRLCPPLTPQEAAGLASRFALDTVANSAGAGAAVLIAYSPEDGREALDLLLPPGVRRIPQRGASLGARMQCAMEDARAVGYGPLVIIGTDSPTLPSGILHTAITILSTGSSDAVFGPTEDGGYYLAGTRLPIRGLFDSVAWSTPRALTDTLRNATALNLVVELLPAWYDVDTPEDLVRLRAEFKMDTAARERAPQTFEWLRLHEHFDNRPYA